MVKKPKPKQSIDFTKLGGTLESLGRGLKEVAVAALTHPTVTALAVMTGSVIVQCLLKSSENSGSRTAKDINYQLGGLYNGAQGIATASVIAPVIVAGFSAAGGAVSSMYGKPPT